MLVKKDIFQSNIFHYLILFIILNFMEYMMILDHLSIQYLSIDISIFMVLNVAMFVAVVIKFIAINQNTIEAIFIYFITVILFIFMNPMELSYFTHEITYYEHFYLNFMWRNIADDLIFRLLFMVFLKFRLVLNLTN
jgi:hypothetical protein